MANSNTIQLHIDEKTKSQAQAVFKKLGTDLSQGVKDFLKKVIKFKSVPPVVLTVNGHTPEYEREMLEEWNAMKNGREKTFKSVADLMKDLNS